MKHNLLLLPLFTRKTQTLKMAVAAEFSDLQVELEKAKENLKSVDENIKKLTGRDPSEFRPYSQQSRRGGLVSSDRLTGRLTGFAGGRRDRDRDSGDGPPAKRRIQSTFSRLGPRDRRHSRDEDSGDDDELPTKPTVQSSVVANPKEQKTRKDCIEEQKSDARGMARNKRMFGLLLGTLQKFRVEEDRKKDKEQKRVEIEKKLEEIAEKEKEELKKERKELFLERRKRQADLRRLEYKMELVKQLEEWEKHHRQFVHFIRTKTKPHVYYLPAKHNDASQKRLNESRQAVEEGILKLRETVEEEIKSIGKRREVTVENEEEEMEEENNVNEEGEIKEQQDNFGSNGPTQTANDREVVQGDVIENDDESKENFPVLILGEPSTDVVAQDGVNVETGNDNVGESAATVVQPDECPDAGEEHANSAETIPTDVTEFLPQEVKKNDNDEKDLDALDSSTLAEKEFEPIYD